MFYWWVLEDELRPTVSSIWIRRANFRRTKLSIPSPSGRILTLSVNHIFHFKTSINAASYFPCLNIFLRFYFNFLKNFFFKFDTIIIRFSLELFLGFDWLVLTITNCFIGRVVSGYKVTRRNNVDEWTLIGKRDPQLPQMFYPVANNITLTKGDTVVSFKNCIIYWNFTLFHTTPYCRANWSLFFCGEAK